MAAEESQVIGCHTLQAWNGQLQICNQSKKLVVVDFTALWCGPCCFIAHFPSVPFLKVDVDELKDVIVDRAVKASVVLIRI
ncbi:ARABIDOPSIS THALIANA THIOREDOXIN H-TYPE 1, thioredoxin H-type 1 [Hibiscus trionum]|uniref:ARABIDOPSIS THALIANA THIOREDOXIN H-TYPE 1, thioredoxin H-type 1 n=1 Tax=Hibiscus trionum TaxID=183268 RepID=A0A9W7M7H4_HIBTR|nr:ARABIDOPSIS THALIANA THIOREDOXIN H-TYPE 1, thioredoxin H-type 1 [Hibiscus trionum]